MKSLTTKKQKRQKANEKMKGFREQMKDQGFKSCTLFLSESFIEELKRLDTEQNMNRAEAMEHIFSVYQKHYRNADYKSSYKKSDSKAETAANIVDLQGQIEILKGQMEMVIEIMPDLSGGQKPAIPYPKDPMPDNNAASTGSPIVETRTEIPAPEPKPEVTPVATQDHAATVEPAPGNQELPEQPPKKELYKLILEVADRYPKNQVRADYLNGLGILKPKMKKGEYEPWTGVSFMRYLTNVRSKGLAN